jgi:hypothetical protein
VDPVQCQELDLSSPPDTGARNLLTNLSADTKRELSGIIGLEQEARDKAKKLTN